MSAHSPRITLDRGEVDLVRGVLADGAEEIALTTREAELLRYLVGHVGQPVDREELHRELWGHHENTVSRAVDTTVARLRRKIEVDPARPRHLLTVHGLGFRFVPLQQGEAAVAPQAAPPLAVGALTLDIARQIAHTPGGPVELSATEARVAEVLGQSPGKVFDRQALRRKVWGAGGSEKALANTLSRLRTKLGRDVIVAVRGRGIKLVPPEAPVTIDEPGPLVGRGDELRELARAVSRSSLVTITGTVGIGKSHLAARLAWDLRSRFRGGMWFVDAGRADSVDDLRDAVAAELDLRVARLGPALAKWGPALLVLDDFSSSVDGVGALVADWLSEAPDLTVLVVGLSPVGLPGEEVVRLEPLPLADAVALFTARALEVRPDLDTQAHAADIEAVVRRVGGLPLGIAVAAARIRTLDPRQLLDRAPGGLDAALRDVWAQLPEAGRGAWAQASVFAAPFALEAAEAVLSLGPGAPPTWEVLDDLVHRSLLEVRTAKLGARFHQLAPLREFGADKLDDPEGVADRHLAWCLALGEMEGPERVAAPTSLRARVLSESFDDLNLARQRALALGRHEDAARLTIAAVMGRVRTGRMGGVVDLCNATLALDGLSLVSRFWLLHFQIAPLQSAGRVDHGRRVGAEALAIAAELDSPTFRVEALSSLASLDLRADPAAARTLLERAVEIARSGPPVPYAAAIGDLGVLCTYQGRAAEAEALYNEAIGILQQTDNVQRLASQLGNRGTLRHNMGLLEDAARDYAEAAAIFAEVGADRSRAIFMSNLGNLHAQLGDLDAAEAAQREAIAISHRLNTPDDGAVAMANLGMLLVNRGQVQAGRDALTRALDVMNESAWPHAATLAALADLDRRQGHLKLARRRMTKAEAHLREFGFKPPLARVLCLRGLLDLEEGDAVAARGALDGARELIAAAHIERTSEIHRQLERLAEALA